MTTQNNQAIVNDIEFVDQYGTEEWQTRRQEIIEIDGHKCRRCGATQKLQVHHLHYINGRKVWQYEDSELVTLCASCHCEIHVYKDQLNKCLFALMDCWCMKKVVVADYYDALQVLQYLTLLGGRDSKVYAHVCTSAGMSFDTTSGVI